MRLNHIDLCVPDVAAAAAFFSNGFGFTVLNIIGDHDMAILRGDGGFVIVLTREAEPVYPDAFHIGFLQESPDAVRRAYVRLLDAGIDVPSAPSEQYGALVFYCHVPGSVPVEISYRG